MLLQRGQRGLPGGVLSFAPMWPPSRPGWGCDPHSEGSGEAGHCHPPENTDLGPHTSCTARSTPHYRALTAARYRLGL